jgi:hypothetical protein
VQSNASAQLRRHFVELGGHEGCKHCTARALTDAAWEGVAFDAKSADALVNLRRERVDIHTVAPLFNRFAISQDFDHLTVALGRDSWWALFAVLAAGFRPRFVCGAFNRNLPPWDALIVEPSRTPSSVQDCYYGASVRAFQQLFASFEYEVLAIGSSAQHVYALRKSELGDAAGWDYAQVLSALPDSAHLCWKDGDPCPDRRWLMFSEGTPLAKFESVAQAAHAMQPVLLQQREETRRGDGATLQIFTKHDVDVKSSTMVPEGQPLTRGCIHDARSVA